MSPSAWKSSARQGRSGCMTPAGLGSPRVGTRQNSCIALPCRGPGAGKRFQGSNWLVPRNSFPRRPSRGPRWDSTRPPPPSQEHQNSPSGRPQIDQNRPFWAPRIDQDGPAQWSRFDQNLGSRRPKNGQNWGFGCPDGPKSADLAAQNGPKFPPPPPAVGCSC